MSTIHPNQSVASAFDPATIGSITSQMGALLDQFEGLVPDLQPHDPRQIKHVATVARFADPLIAPTINTITAVSFVPAGLFDADRARLAVMYRDFVRPLAQRVLVLGGAMNFSVDAKLAITGQDILQMYAWAQRTASGPYAAALKPWFDEMQRVMKKAINHRRKASTPTTPPASAQSFMANSREESETEELELPDNIYDLFRDIT